MPYPDSDVDTTHFDAGTDNPATARTSFLDLAQKFNALRNWITVFGRGLINAPNASVARNALGVSPSGTRMNWLDKEAAQTVVGMLAWRNYGNGHVIFDSSSLNSPDGTPVSRSDPRVYWQESCPTLMGWNGVDTYGVRVDSARVADIAKTVAMSIPAGTLLASNGLGGFQVGTSGFDSSQTYKDLTTIYAKNTTYTNTSSKPIYFSNVILSGTSYSIVLGGFTTVSGSDSVFIVSASLNFIVPPGLTFRLNATYGFSGAVLS